MTLTLPHGSPADAGLPASGGHSRYGTAPTAPTVYQQPNACVRTPMAGRWSRRRARGAPRSSRGAAQPLRPSMSCSRYAAILSRPL